MVQRPKEAGAEAELTRRSRQQRVSNVPLCTIMARNTTSSSPELSDIELEPNAIPSANEWMMSANVAEKALLCDSAACV